MKPKNEELLKTAQEVASSTETWADLSNALFDSDTGIIAKAFPTRGEREQFLRTKEYRAIRQLIDDALERTGLVEGATPKKSGKFIVRLPRSLHTALDAEGPDAL